MSIIVAFLQAVLLVAIAPLISGIARNIRAKMHSSRCSHSLPTETLLL